MNFVNKLSVISLLVLMFSFMNVATAVECTGSKVKACSNVKDQSTCASSYSGNSGGKGNQCIWNTLHSTCSADTGQYGGKTCSISNQ